MSPEAMLKKTIAYAENLEKAMDAHVAVGLPKDKVGGKIYGGGLSIIVNGAQHEYGAGKLPQRSFLRMPFEVKKADLEKQIAVQFKAVAEQGRSAEQAMGRVGAAAVNISKTAFTTQGFGQWPASDKSGTTMVDTGTLRNSITWAVRT